MASPFWQHVSKIQILMIDKMIYSKLSLEKLLTILKEYKKLILIWKYVWYIKDKKLKFPLKFSKRRLIWKKKKYQKFSTKKEKKQTNKKIKLNRI